MPAERLEGCLRDLVTLLSLPSIWRGRRPVQILQSAIEAIPHVVSLELAYGRLGAGGAGGRHPGSVFYVGPELDTPSVRDRLRALQEQGDEGAKPLDILESVSRKGGTQSLRVVSFPLGFYGHVGEVLFASTREDFPDLTETVLLRTASSLIATSIESAHHLEALEAAHERAAFLSEASNRLTASLDLTAILTTLGQLTVPILAGASIVHRVVPRTGLERVALVCPEGPQAASIERWLRTYPAQAADAAGPGKVFRTRAADEVADLAGAVSDTADRELGRAGVTSRLSLPLVVRGNVAAVLTLLRLHPERDFDPAQRLLAEELSRRAATALDNSLLYQEAQEAVATRDAFLSVASHELNTPITSLKLNLQQVLRLSTKGEDDGLSAPVRLRERMSGMDKQLSRLTNLVRELLDMSRLSSGKLRLEPEPMDLAALVGEVVARSQDDVSRSGCAVVVSADAPVLGKWDRLRLDQVVTNLLSNALKYGHDGEVRLTVWADTDAAWFSVRDEGIGIPEDELPRLFHRFERVANPSHYSGWGLGLWIVKQILDAAGGTIAVQSAPGQGSTFTIRLPREPPSAARSPPYGVQS